MIPDSIINSVAQQISNEIKGLSFNTLDPDSYSIEVWKIVVRRILEKVDSMTINLSYSSEVQVVAPPYSGNTVGFPAAVSGINTNQKTWN